MLTNKTPNEDKNKEYEYLFYQLKKRKTLVFLFIAYTYYLKWGIVLIKVAVYK